MGWAAELGLGASVAGLGCWPRMAYGGRRALTPSLLVLVLAAAAAAGRTLASVDSAVCGDELGLELGCSFRVDLVSWRRAGLVRFCVATLLMDLSFTGRGGRINKYE